MKAEVTVKEQPGMQQVDFQMIANPNGTWKYAGKNFTSKATHSVAVKATWNGPKAGTDTAIAAQFITVQ